MITQLLAMKAGLVADIVVAIIIIVNLIICTRVGFIRCVLKCFSTVVALVVAMLTAAPLTRFFDGKFGWIAAVEKWNVPFVSAETLLKLMIGIVVFVLVRLVCLLIDKLLAHLKEKLKAVSVLDRIFGTVFGFIAALVELTLIFALIDQFGWASFLSLTEEGGGYFAWRLFEFCQKYMFNLLTNIFAFAAEQTPKF